MSKGKDESVGQKPFLNVGTLSQKDNKVKTVAPTPVKDQSRKKFIEPHLLHNS